MPDNNVPAHTRVDLPEGFVEHFGVGSTYERAPAWNDLSEDERDLYRVHPEPLPPVLAPPERGRYRAYMHACGAVEWMTVDDKAETLGGCDRCESGSDNPNDWQPVFTSSGHGGGAE